MHKKLVLALGAVALGIGFIPLWQLAQRHSGQSSPYVSQLDSPVKGLSPQEVEDLLQGNGAGYARTAELNSYPGPRHVLDLSQELALSPEQTTTAEVIFDDMQARAQQLGKTIVDQEQQLSQSFESAAITASNVQAQTQDLGALYGELRAVHLQAHLDVKAVLSEEQIAQYDELRGYTGNGAHSGNHAH